MSAVFQAGHDRGAGAEAFEAVDARPYFTSTWLAAAVAMSALALQLSAGAISVLVFLAAVGFLFIRRPEASLLAVIRWLPALSFPLLAIASTLWSDAPGQSLRIGGMLLLSLASAIVIADPLTARQFVGATLAGLLVLIIGSLISNNYMPSISGRALYGLAGSKNPLGYMSMLATLMAAAVMLDRGQPPMLRMVALAGAPLSLLTLFLSKSVGAFVSGGFGVFMFVGLVVVHAIPPRGRVLAILAAIIVVVPMAANWQEVKTLAQDFQEDVLKRDSTLTGRTYLWERADAIIKDRPLVGHGYSSFWRQGQLDAEGLWRWGGIPGRMGFNFHNEYVETKVALGYVGLIVLIATMIGLAGPLLLRALFAPSIAIACLAASVLPMYLRTSAEYGLIATWSLATVVLYAAAVYGRRGDVAPEDVGRRPPAPPNEVVPAGGLKAAE